MRERILVTKFRLKTASKASPAKTCFISSERGFRRCLALAVLAVGVAAALAAPDVAGQTGPPARKPAAGGIPRMPDGHPDLQGTYDLATLTPLQRAAGSPLVLTDDQAKKLEQQMADRTAREAGPVAADRTAPPTGGDGSPGPYGNVGGYNNFW